jgi:ribosomal protein S18 acetylase RimI-like enzyme
MRSHISWGAPLSDENPTIEVLQAKDVRDLRLPWLSRFSSETLRMQLLEVPGMSLWVPRTGEYLVAEPWRRRSDIAQVLEVTARKGKPALLNELMARLQEAGYSLVLMTSDVWYDDPKAYSGLGIELLERIVFFHKELGDAKSSQPARELPALDFTLLSLGELDLLLQVDHASFPWLWWNSPREFENYMQMEGVYVYLARLAGAPVGYASFTMYQGWAHLDRLAVIESQQGKGYGAAQLVHTLRAMEALGAGSVNLSTQENNIQSHKLYKGFGFKRARDVLSLYGKYLDAGERRG